MQRALLYLTDGTGRTVRDEQSVPRGTRDALCGTNSPSNAGRTVNFTVRPARDAGRTAP